MTAAAPEEAPQAQPEVPAVRVVEWATVPRVNLLPREILEGRRFRRVQALLGLAVVAVLALAGLAVVWAGNGVTDAQTDLDAAQDRVRALQVRQAQYAEVPRVTAQLDALTSARAEAMATDVAWYRYLTDLRAAQPSGVSFEELTVTMSVGTTAAGAGAAGASPLSTTGIGSLGINGKAASTRPGGPRNAAYDGVAAWMDALDKVNGIDGVTLTTATKDAGSTADPAADATFESTGVFTDKALSHLFDEGTAG